MDDPPASVFVTGANGFMGRALTERYRSAGVDVAGVDVTADPDRGVIAGDVLDPSGWADAIAPGAVVIHTAAIVSNNIATERAWEVNVVGTQRVLDAATGAGAERFVQISTMGVTRFAHTHAAAARRILPGRELDERWPLMPTGNPYTDTKITAEHLVLAAPHAAGRQACTIIRPADVYGPGCRPWVLEPLEAIRSGRMLLPARGRGLFTPIHIDDLLDGVVAAAARPAAAGQIFHLGGEEPVTTLEYFGHLARMIGRPAPRTAPTAVAVAAAEATRWVAVARRRHTEVGRGVMAMLAKTRAVSNEKAHRDLDWWPRVSLSDGMADVERWLRSEGLLDDTR